MEPGVNALSFAVGGGRAAAIAALSQKSQAAFALLCAERLVRTAPSSEGAEVAGRAIESGWSAASDNADDLRVIRAELDAREDLDEDYLAATAHALDAVLGDLPDAADRAAERGTDHAFALVANSYDDTQFRPLTQDAADPIVQAEVNWQAHAIAQLGTSAISDVLLAELRKNA